MLCTPVPKVLAWSSRTAENSVGAEYIIMEKVAGVQLNKVWPGMSIKERFELVKTISGYQKAWMSTSFGQYGSLYYSSDIDDSHGCDLVKGDKSTKSHRFAVGPSTGREFLDDGLMALDFDRGPCMAFQVAFFEDVCLYGYSRDQCRAIQVGSWPSRDYLCTEYASITSISVISIRP